MEMTSELVQNTILSLDKTLKIGLDKKLSNDLHSSWENIEDISTLHMYGVSIKPDDLISEIINEFNSINVDEESFNRIKKVWIAREIKELDDIECMADNMCYDLIRYRKVITNKIDIIKNMKFKTLKDIIKKIDFKNYSIVKMEKE